MKTEEEEFQNINEEDNDDARVYRRVLHGLKQEPVYELSADFAHRIIGIIEKKEKRNVPEHVWLATVPVFIITALGITAGVMGFTFNWGSLNVFPALNSVDWGFLNSMADYKGILIFGASFIVLLDFIDRRFIRRSVV